MLRYFKGQPTDYIFRYTGGRMIGKGPGLAFFYFPYNTQVVAVPTQSLEAAFVFAELTRDYQAVTLQGQATYGYTQFRDDARGLHRIAWDVSRDAAITWYLDRICAYGNIRANGQMTAP